MPNPKPAQLSDSEVTALEAAFDAAFNSAGLPSDSRYDARHAVLTVGEDLSRFALMEAAKHTDRAQARAGASRLVGRLDRNKYALKEALALIDRRLPAGKPSSFKVEEGPYLTAAELLEKHADEYANASRAFWTSHRGDRKFERVSPGKLRLSERQGDGGYPALEWLQNADDDGGSPVMMMLQMFRGRDYFDQDLMADVSWAPEIRKLVAGVSLRRGKIRYQFITNFGRVLYEDLSTASSVIPPDWVFPWGSQEETSAVLLGLQARAAYHLIAIHFGAERLRRAGLGVEQLCLDISLQELISEVARVSRVPANVVNRVLHALTYGHQTRSPDPALQPIVELGGGRVAVAPLLIVSSNWSRNLLALHARLDSKTFDAQSHRFEKTMVGPLTDLVNTRWVGHPSKTVPTRPTPEEIDVLIVDEETNTLVVCELRWMNQPGDAQEVIQRQKNCREKVQQAIRKRDRIRADLPTILKHLGEDATRTWSVEALVVIDGYGGTVSPNPKACPVVPRKVLEIARAPSALHLHAALATETWMPRENRNYTSGEQDFDLAGETLTMPMFNLMGEPYLPKSLPAYLDEAFARPVEDLQMEPWPVASKLSGSVTA